jgi:hypothetical protein
MTQPLSAFAPLSKVEGKAKSSDYLSGTFLASPMGGERRLWIKNTAEERRNEKGEVRGRM